MWWCGGGVVCLCVMWWWWCVVGCCGVGVVVWCGGVVWCGVCKTVECTLTCLASQLRKKWRCLASWRRRRRIERQKRSNIDQDKENSNEINEIRCEIELTFCNSSTIIRDVLV